MKLLFLHRDLPPDSYTGVAIQVHRLATALSERGHEVSIFTHSPKPEGARYQVLPIRQSGLRLALRLLPGLKRLWHPLFLRRLPMEGYDAVHVHGDGGFLTYRANYLRTFYGTAALESRHARGLRGKLAQGLSYWMERREARRCGLCVGISPHIREHLPGVTQVVPCMLPGEPGRDRPQKTAHPSLLFIGSRFSRKRGELALEIFRKLRVSRPELTLDYVGPPCDAEELRGSPACEGVEFHTRVEQERLSALYRRSWIYLCLSSYEGFGVGLIEAMALSCLAVTTPHPGSDFLVKDGETALVAAPGEMEATLGRALSDAGLRDRIAAKALEAAQAFSPGTVAAAYESLYQEARRRGEAAA